jgi:DNA-directed RNA polymerase specialized sigma24 family protein
MTPNEMRNLIENLSPDDEDQLWVWALRLRRNYDAAEDLLHDTLAALLAQTYPWKEGVPFRPHAYWVMRRIYTEQVRKPGSKTVSVDDVPDIEEHAHESDPEKALAVGLDDTVYQAVLEHLPSGFARELWKAMYEKGANTIAEQMALFGLDARSRIDTARKVIKRVCREVFEEFGLTYTEPSHQGRGRHDAK